MNPPTGTVTFLFTDIEGSTKRWEAYPQEMRSALQRHDAILRGAIEDQGGYVFKTMGDAFCAAFSSPRAALSAARDLQRALSGVAWSPPVGELVVRAALHTGIADELGGDYFGQPLNRVARILSAGHGGQTLLSDATYELVRDNLPTGMSLLSMGEHRLKDLYRPEHIYQLYAEGLRTEFPPLRTLDNQPNNLPRLTTALVGREQETKQVLTLLRRSDVALVTLTGPGGTGKTRLGLQVAAEALDDFPGGVWLVDLAPLTDAGLILSTIAQVLGVSEAAGKPLPDALRDYLKEKQLLLVLDNFEQVLDAAPSVASLVRASAGVKVLVTSRVKLGVYGEHEHAIPPLSLPDMRHLPPLDTLTQYEAVRLFIERAQAAKSDFTVTNENAPAVAEICARLDGLPLAIELAAARVKMLTPQALLTRLSSRLKLLIGGSKDLSARQQTLRGTIDWSYDLLSNEEKQFFRRMAVFQGGRTLEALESVCNSHGNLEMDTLDGVQSLVDKSLLLQREGRDSEPHFRMLETIHEYAREKLQESGEEDAMKAHHAAYFLSFAEQAELNLTSREQVLWLDKIEEEHDNIRAALDWSMKGGDPQLLHRMSKALWRFWWMHSHLAEGSKWIETALSEGRGESPELRGWLIYGLSIIRRATGERDTDTQPMLEEALSIFQSVGDKQGEAWCLNDMALLAENRNDFTTAEALLEESLRLKRENGDQRDINITLSNLGELTRWRGDYRAAELIMREALASQRSLQDKYGMAITLNNLAYTLQNLGEYEQAISLFKESLLISQELGSTIYVAGCLAGLAGVLSSLRRPEVAAQLFAAIEPILQSTNAVLDPGDRRDYEHSLPATRAQLTDAEWERAWQKGHAMSMEEAIEYALEAS